MRSCLILLRHLERKYGGGDIADILALQSARLPIWLHWSTATSGSLSFRRSNQSCCATVLRCAWSCRTRRREAVQERQRAVEVELNDLADGGCPVWRCLSQRSGRRRHSSKHRSRRPCLSQAQASRSTMQRRSADPRSMPPGWTGWSLVAPQCGRGAQAVGPDRLRWRDRAADAGPQDRAIQERLNPNPDL